MVVSDVDVQEAAYHFLVLSAMLFGLLFEVIYRIFAQSDCDFDLFFVERQFTWKRQEIINNPDIAQGLIRVSYFLFHKFTGIPFKMDFRHTEYFIGNTD